MILCTWPAKVFQISWNSLKITWIHVAPVPLFVPTCTLITDFISSMLQSGLAITCTISWASKDGIHWIAILLFSTFHSNMFVFGFSEWITCSCFVVTSLLVKPVRRAKLDQNHLRRWFGWMWIKCVLTLSVHFVWTLECALKWIERTFVWTGLYGHTA